MQVQEKHAYLNLIVSAIILILYFILTALFKTTIEIPFILIALFATSSIGISSFLKTAKSLDERDIQILLCL